MPVATGGADDNASAVFRVELPAGYRDGHLIGVAHEAGSLNDLRALLRNDIAVRVLKDRTRPYADGAMIASVACPLSLCREGVHTAYAAERVAKATRIAIEIVPKPKDHVGFVIHPRRWVVERRFA